MGFTCAQGLLILLTASMLATGMANKDWPWGFNNTAGWGYNYTASSGSNYTAGWGFNNTTDWHYNYTAGSGSNYTTGWSHNYTAGWDSYHPNATDSSPKKIIVGGSDHWHFGFNYSDWALNNGPFYLNDVLVFKYDPPNSTTFPHTVYLFPNLWSFLNCDMKKGKMIANVTQGGDNGFEFELKRWKPYYFACGERDGFHCKVGMMKFFITPIFHY